MKRRIVKNRRELIDFINTYNGLMNCYFTIYDFERFNDNIKIDSSIILDRAFLDFDAHGDKTLQEAFDDMSSVLHDLVEDDIKFKAFFSGKGFHVIVFGEEAENIRQIQRWYLRIKEGRDTLDDSGIQTNRLRRIPNTVNMSSSDENGEPYFCIPLVIDDLIGGLDGVLALAKEPRLVDGTCGHELISWPSVEAIEISKEEIVAPKPIGKLPILPCLHNAIMVENPGHYARVYLALWYRDIIALGERNITRQKKEEIMDMIMSEFEHIANSKPDVWGDWNEQVTRGYLRGVVEKGYNAPGCKNVLIPQGYCIGKCWRYAE